MRFKTTYILGIVFIALVAFIYFYEIEGGKRRKAKEEEESKFLHFKKEDVYSVKLSSDKDTVVYRRIDDENWELIKPVRARAYKSNIESNLRTFETAKIERVISEKLVDLSQYGLHKPRAVVELTMKDSSEIKALIGDENPTGSYVFAKLADSSRIITTYKSFYNAASRTAFDFRDRRLLFFKRDEVRKISLLHGGEKIEVEKRGDEWRMIEPVVLKASRSKISSILSRLSNDRAQRYVEETPSDLRKYGITEPTLTAKVFLGESLGEKKLIIGKKVIDEKKKYYARDDSRNPVFTVDSSLVAALMVKPFDIQDKKLLSFTRGNVDKITIRYADSLLVFVKDDTSGWSIMKPDTIPIKKSEGNRLLNRLSNLKAKELVTYTPQNLKKFGLLNPEMSVELYSSGNKLDALLVGKRRGEKAYVKSYSSEPVYWMDWKDVDYFRKAPDDFKVKDTGKIE